MSGTFSISTTNSYIVGSVYWEERNVNTSANQSDVYVEMKLWRSNSGYTTYGTGNFYVTVNGTQLSHTGESYTLSYNSNTLVLSGTVTVPHNSDGSKTVTISWSGNGDSGFTINGGSGSATLTSIARQSTISSGVYWTAGTQNLGVSLSVSSSSYHHTLTVQLVNASGVATNVATRTNVGSSTTIVFTQSEITSMYNWLAQGSRVDAILYCDTYDSAGTHIGSQTNKSGSCYAINATKGTMPDFNIGVTQTISLNPPNSSFTHTIQWSWGSYSTTIATGVTGTSYTWNQKATDSSISDTFANGMFKQIPNSTSSWGTLKVTTYYNGVQVQSTVSTYPINGYVLGSYPVFNSGSITYADTNSVTTGITGNNQNIVQNHSTLSVTIPLANKATAVDFATMSSYSITVNGVTESATWSSTANVTVSLGTVSAGSNVTCTVTAIDSRGRQTSQSITIQVTPYSPPVAIVTATRQNNFDTNTTLALNGSYSVITPTGSGTGNKLGTVQYKYKDASVSTWGAWNAFAIASNTAPNYTATSVTLNLDNTKSWNVEVTVSDSLTTTTVDKLVGTGQPLMFMDTGKKTVSFGQLPVNSNAFEFGNPIYEQGVLLSKKYSPYATGSIQMYAGTTAPSGYLLCNGQSVSRATYPDLFNVCGTRYNNPSDTDSTMFRLPNLVGRMPVGLYSGDPDFTNLGATGGEKTHTLTTTEMPSHDHATTAKGGYYFYGGSSGNPASGSGYGTQANSLRTDSQGGGQAHNNMPPYVVLNFIIKI